MKTIFLFIAIFMLSFSLAAAAVEVSTNQLEYSSGQTVTATITGCIGTSLVEFRNPSGSVVDIKAGEDDWSATYNTLSDSEDGKYKVEATCTNGAGQSNFCVDAPSCISTGTSSQTGSSGGGGSCTPNWSCTDWSFCGPTLTQTRTCTDLNNCQTQREESRPCESCLESWVCSLWAECSAGVQSRACYDEHFCETSNLKPGLQKGCNEMDPIPPPARISSQLPPPYVPPPAAAQQSFLSKTWENYKMYIIGGAAAILLAVMIILAIHIFMPKKVAYNINELKQWVRKEKEMGTSDTDIREILKQNTGWTDQEVDLAFQSQQPSRTVNSKTSSA